MSSYPDIRISINLHTPSVKLYTSADNEIIVHRRHVARSWRHAYQIAEALKHVYRVPEQFIHVSNNTETYVVETNFIE